MVIVLIYGSIYRTQSRQRTLNLDIFLPLYPWILSHNYPNIIQHMSFFYYILT